MFRKNNHQRFAGAVSESKHKTAEKSEDYGQPVPENNV
jgi:hypothetical protein